MANPIRALSSVGRASPLQGEGQKFESSNAHHKKQDDISYSVFYFVVLMTWTSNCECNLIKFMTNEKIICHAELVSASYQSGVFTTFW